MTKMTQGPWTRIRPLQIDDVDAKTAAAIKTGELTRGGFPNNLVKVMAYCPRFVQLEVEYANSFMFVDVRVVLVLVEISLRLPLLPRQLAAKSQAGPPASCGVTETASPTDVFA